MKRVAVIGAGAAGLATLRHLAVKRNLYEVTAFEASDRIGGTWKYSETSVVKPLHGAMYQNLLTNLPKEIMAFPDMEFEDRGRSFIPHYHVQQYLEQYAEKFHLIQYIKFNTYVQHVSRTDNKWTIVTSQEDAKETHEFDSVFVCNGHFSEPYIPDIEGMNEFNGSLDHSRNYRKPDEYKDKTVVLLGARPSGQDISVDISTVAKRVILSHRDCPLKTPLPENVHQRFGIVRFTKNGVVFQDGVQEDDVDHVIFCTGYKYSFPFVDESCGIVNANGRITPLYKHLVNVSNPSMFFIGICAVICPFPNFDTQVRYALAWLEDAFTKPDESTMMKWIEDDFTMKTQALGWKEKYAHVLAELQWHYLDDLVAEAGIEPLKRVVSKIYEQVGVHRKDNVLTYRTYDFNVMNENEYTYRQRST